MKSRAVNPSGDQLIREYLTRVAQAGLGLPKGARMKFVGSVKSRIERELGPEGAADAGRVMAVLESVGPPEELVRAERAKIDAAWVKRRAGNREAGEAAAAAVTAPRQYRRVNSRWRPATYAQPLPTDTGPQPAEGKTGQRTGRSRLLPRRQLVSPVPEAPSSGAAPQQPQPGATPQEPPAGAAPPQPGAGPAPQRPPLSPVPDQPPPGPAPEPAPEDHDTAQPGPSRPVGPQLTLATVTGLARENLLESVAIVLLGLGGLLFPVLPPVWAAGSLVALLPSRVLDVRDKWIALLGPLVFTAAVSVVIAVVDRVSGNFVVVYFQAFGAGAGYLIRIGCLLCAGYLAWRIYQGPRAKVPPWKRPGAAPDGR
jgi:hypothetical protein